MSEKNSKLPTRADIKNKNKWDIEKMYPDEKKWDLEIENYENMADDFKRFSGRLGDDSKTMLHAFKSRDDIWRGIEKIYVYARMKKDEDNSDPKYQAMSDKSQTLIAKASASMSFFTPEFIALDEDKVRTFIGEEDGLKVYEHVIDVMFREKKHVLGKSEENIMAQMAEVTSATGDIFTMLNNADMKFGTVKDDEGNEIELTHGNYIVFMESKNQEVRKAAYEAMYDAYIAQKNTIATTYSYNTKVDVVTSRIRKYPSSLVSALSGDNVPQSVYDNLIKSVNENLPTMHKYLDIRKNLLGQKKLNMYDIYVPLIQVDEKDISFEEAVDIMINGLSPLGLDYTSQVKKGIEARWVDRYENVGKTSGAYSFGCYDSMPYILMNYTKKLKDVFTLIHEMGHSMHSYFTRKTQPYVYGGHSIFTAEVASTVNESLLIRYLIDNTDDKEMKKYLINMHIDDFRTTLFRQTMFAEFEKKTHESVEKGEVLTAEYLSNMYGELNKKYYGKNVETDERISMEWARIPHFYRAFYVYKYATGYSAATAISEKILTEGEPAVKQYIKFLESGDSDDPIELLKIAGVDMGTTEPVENAMNVFKGLVDKFESMV